MDDLSKVFKLAAGLKGINVETKTILLSEACHSELVVYLVRDMAVKAGFNSIDEFMIATAASELTTNILRFAGNGELTASIIKEKKTDRTGIELFACDSGPGIPDVKKAMQEQYSTLKNSLGMGLPSVKNLMDDFFIESIVGKGTRVLAIKWKEHEKYC